MSETRLKYVDPLALAHLARGLTYDPQRYSELIDSALVGLNAQTGYAERMLSWISDGGLAAGPPPKLATGRVIVDVTQYNNAKNEPLHMAAILSQPGEAEIAPVVFFNLRSPALDIPMRTEIPLRAVLVGNPPLTGTYTLYQHVLRTNRNEEYVYYGITKRGWNLRFSEHTRLALKQKSGRMLPRKLDELIRARADARFGRSDDREMLDGIISSLCAVGLSKDAAFETEEYLIDKYSLAGKHPYGLNMVPGGHAGIAFVQRFKRSARGMDDVSFVGLTLTWTLKVSASSAMSKAARTGSISAAVKQRAVKRATSITRSLPRMLSLPASSLRRSWTMPAVLCLMPYSVNFTCASPVTTAAILSGISSDRGRRRLRRACTSR